MSTIIVLDDLRTSRSILTQLAFTVEKDVCVEAFARPDEALAWVKEHTPDLVITDYEMPGMNGSEFIRRFREIDTCQDVPIIVVTIHEDPEFRHKALQMGATDFLLSPVDHDEFRARSQNLLSLRARHQSMKSRAEGLAKAIANKDRRFRDALRESRSQLEGVIDAVPSLINVTDRRSRFMFMNRYHEEILGIRPSDAVGRTVTQVMGEAYGRRHAMLDRQVYELGKTLPAFEEVLIDRYGMERTFLTTKSPLGARNGDVMSVVTASIDITTRKAAERELESARDTAEAANRTKTEFLAHISHELRTPLNAVVGFSEMMTEEMFGSLGCEKYREYAAAIHDSGLHLLDIINEMLDLSVAEIGKLELQEELVDPVDILAACCRMMADQASDAQVTLNYETDPRLPLLLADGRKLRQIVINLLSNAIKFTPAGGHVSALAGISAEGDFELTVVDTGIGIPRNHLERVLTPFGQVESALSRKYSGAGLGLPLSKRLAELHGGRLELASIEGEGTSVRVILPGSRLVTRTENAPRASA
jgi:PAS domain S-box-containing protein